MVQCHNLKVLKSLLHLTSWCELCGSSETVDGERVAQVVRQVLDWALACDNGLDEESKHREHSLHAARFVTRSNSTMLHNLLV